MTSLRLTHHVLSDLSGNPIPLANEVVQVWQVGLDVAPDYLARLVALLSVDERERMGRFHFEHHRQRYAAAHGQLRLILSAYLACSPTQLRFMTGHYGKPALQDGSDVCFNLSHAGDQMLVGVVRGRAIGVDIEQIRPDFATTEIAASYFSSAEQGAFQAVPDAQKPQAFFNAWTRKEAFIKAIGQGLSFPLGDFDVTLVPGEPARLLAVRGSTEEAARWQMWGWDAGDGYAAAVVVAR